MLASPPASEDVGRTSGIDTEGAELGCKKFCKGFPPPTPGAKFEEVGLDNKAVNRAYASVTDRSGSEGGFAVMESYVVLASSEISMVSLARSVSATISGCWRGVCAAAAARRLLRRLLAAISNLDENYVLFLVQLIVYLSLRLREFVYQLSILIL